MKNGIKIKLITGNICAQKCDAYIVPEYPERCSEHGVAGAVALSGGKKGIEEYGKHCPLAFNSAVCTTSYGGNAKYLLHVATLGCEKEKKFTTIQKAVYLALLNAEDMGIESIACPALGFEKIDNFLASHSAQAILSAVNLFPNQKKIIKEFRLIDFYRTWAYEGFRMVYANELYKNARSPDEPDFSLADWITANVAKTKK